MEFAARVSKLSSSPTLAITAKAKQLKESGIDVVSFGAGEPDFDTPQYIKEAAIKALQKGFTKYTPSTGTVQLKQAIVEKFKRDNKLNYEAGQIVVCNGAKHALYNIFQAICDRKDQVIIPMPYWVSYPEMVNMAEGKSVFVKTKAENSFKLTAQALRKKINKRTKAIVINSPSNPTGCVYTRKELEEIAAVAVENNIFVISDEIYEKLIYDGLEHVSIASLNEKIYNLTFTVNGLSKSYSMTGWRIGYLAGPKEAISKISNMQDHSTSCPNSIAQAAALEALNYNEEFIENMRKEFLARRDYMIKRIAGMKKLKVVKPQGAFYVFCKIAKTGLDCVTFSKRLLDEAQVAVIPGEGFGCNDYIRLSFATSMEQITKGMDRLEQWVNKLLQV